MKKRALVFFTLACLFYLYTTSFAQDVIPVFNDSQAQAAAPPDTPVNGIGDALATAYGDFMGLIINATSGLGSALTGSFRGLAIPLVALSVMFFSLRMISGNTGDARKMLHMLVLACLVTGFVFSPGTYQEWIAGPIIDTINGVSSFLIFKSSGGKAGSLISTLSGGMDKVMAACVQLDRVDSWMPTKLIAALIAQIVLSASYLMIMVTFLLINLMTWFAIYLLNVFGAICLFFIIFAPTRHIFWAWLRAMCNYGLVIVFTSLIMGVCLKVMGPQLDKLALMDYGSVHPLLNSATFTCVAINVLSWCMLLRAPDLAAALSGGSAGNTAGIAGVVSMTAGAAYAGAKYLSLRAAPLAAGNVASWASGTAGAPGGGTMGALARRAGRGLSPSARKGIDNSDY